MPIPAQRDAEESARQLAAWLAPKLGADGPVDLGAFRGPGATGFSNETIIVDAIDGEIVFEATGGMMPPDVPPVELAGSPE